MTSFTVAIEPAAVPRLAAAAVLVHAGAAACPWLAHVPAPLAAAISLLALAGLGLTLGRLPGRHAELAALVLDGRGCRIRRRGSRAMVVAQLGPRSRAYAGMVLVEVRAGSRRYGWLLSRAAVAPDPFRRLKARIRLSC